ncbi:MAG: hypothetical protein KDA89_18380 [Planctomycetaceae bacterium]|nr:hypothetical protein [Planctomycetaceae bacterium]
MLLLFASTADARGDFQSETDSAYESDLWGQEFLRQENDRDSDNPSESVDEKSPAARTDKPTAVSVEDRVPGLLTDTEPEVADIMLLPDSSGTSESKAPAASAWELSKVKTLPKPSSLANLPTGPTAMTLLVAINALVVVSGALFSPGSSRREGKNAA